MWNDNLPAIVVVGEVVMVSEAGTAAIVVVGEVVIVPAIIMKKIMNKKFK